MLAIVQAGGQGSRMDVLTRERAKPALPFAGTHRLIDFVLSSLVHSGISDVWVSVQYQAGSLDQHLAGGRPWDLDRLRGGFRRMVPEEGSGLRPGAGWSRAAPPERGGRRAAGVGRSACGRGSEPRPCSKLVCGFLQLGKASHARSVSPSSERR